MLSSLNWPGFLIFILCLNNICDEILGPNSFVSCSLMPRAHTALIGPIARRAIYSPLGRSDGSCGPRFLVRDLGCTRGALGPADAQGTAGTAPELPGPDRYQAQAP